MFETISADSATVSVSALPNTRLPVIVALPETVRLSDIVTLPEKLAVLVEVFNDQTSPVYPSYVNGVTAIEPQSLARPPTTSCGFQLEDEESYLSTYPSASPVKSTSSNSPM